MAINPPPWPPVKPMDPQWLITFGKEVTKLTEKQQIDIDRSFQNYYDEINAASVKLEKALDEIAGINFMNKENLM